MKILIDMNLSPEWVKTLKQEGWEAIHWSSVGNPKSPDHQIVEWARTHEYIVFTHDLDFGAILASTKAEGPSIIQARVQDVMPKSLKKRLVPILRQYENMLN